MELILIHTSMEPRAFLTQFVVASGSESAGKSELTVMLDRINEDLCVAHN